MQRAPDLVLVGVGVLPEARRLLGAVLLGRGAEGPLDGGEPGGATLLVPHRHQPRRAAAAASGIGAAHFNRS
jgi:hypothetical protein